MNAKQDQYRGITGYPPALAFIIHEFASCGKHKNNYISRNHIDIVSVKTISAIFDPDFH